jgi:hypothetical protein
VEEEFLKYRVLPSAITIFPLPEIGGGLPDEFSIAFILMSPDVELVVVKSAPITILLPYKKIAPLIVTGAFKFIIPRFERELEKLKDLLTAVEVIELETVIFKLLPEEGIIVKLLETKAVSITEGATVASAVTVRFDPEILQPVPDVPVSPVLEIVSV